MSSAVACEPAVVPTFGHHNADIRYENRRSAYAVILRGDSVATVRTRRGGYFLPGGGALAGESPEQTVLREVSEELGRTGNLIRHLGEAEQFFFASPDNKHYRMQAVFFVLELTGCTVRSGDSDEESLCWLSVADARKSLFHACHVWAVETAMQTHGAVKRAAVVCR